MFKKNFEEIQSKITIAAERSGRRLNDVRLVAVTKKVDATRIRQAYELGLRDFAENYVQEATLKQAALADLEDIRWHFIGSIQSNKVKLMVGRFDLIHSVDRTKIVDELALRSNENTQEILLEVNLAGEESKTGCAVEDLPQLIEQVQSKNELVLRGLMFMPPLHYKELELTRYYQTARKLREQMSQKVSAPHSLNELSMGTSHDYEIAVQEGATIVRLGTVLFGRRQ